MPHFALDCGPQLDHTTIYFTRTYTILLHTTHTYLSRFFSTAGIGTYFYFLHVTYCVLSRAFSSSCRVLLLHNSISPFFPMPVSTNSHSISSGLIIRGARLAVLRPPGGWTKGWTNCDRDDMASAFMVEQIDVYISVCRS